MRLVGPGSERLRRQSVLSETLAAGVALGPLGLGVVLLLMGVMVGGLGAALLGLPP